jgi:MtN3 and saliva related transmembrane protein
MDLPFVEYIGFAAGTLTSAAYLPQVYKTWRSKAVDDISLAMCWALTLGIALWMLYGVLLRAVAVIAANGVSLLLVGTMLRMKLRYGGGKKPGGTARAGGASGGESPGR